MNPTMPGHDTPNPVEVGRHRQAHPHQRPFPRRWEWSPCIEIIVPLRRQMNFDADWKSVGLWRNSWTGLHHPIESFWRWDQTGGNASSRPLTHVSQLLRPNPVRADRDAPGQGPEKVPPVHSHPLEIRGFIASTKTRLQKNELMRRHLSPLHHDQQIKGTSTPITLCG